ncbi:hypothetical protein G3I40_03125 [Streptomyces sp. SID14478]|nr:hypothetical protein [Streptomyces sp. SID14478]
MGARWRRLWQTVAVGGLGLSLYAGWLTIDDVRDRAASERDIAAACDHLISGAQVMNLQGGMVRAQSDGYDEYRLDARHLPSACTLYKVTGAHRTSDLLRLIVESSDGDQPVNMTGRQGSPFLTTTDGHEYKRDVTAIADRMPEPWPLGDGTLGSYTNTSTTIRAECGPGSGAAAPKLLNVTAVARYQNVSAGDRERLARIARAATQKLTRRIDCKAQLPALPAQLAELPVKLRPVASATGSCRWAGRLVKEQGQGRLPDRALAVPVRDVAPVEGCLLAVGPHQVRDISDGLDFDQRDYAESALTSSPWWLRTVSYVGAEAQSVANEEVGAGEDVRLRPGTAGGRNGTWWASSTCDGKPALHTLTVDHLYDDILGPRALDSLFRAYVDDITTRRGCTHVTFPDAKDFHTL